MRPLLASGPPPPRSAYFIVLLKVPQWRTRHRTKHTTKTLPLNHKIKITTLKQVPNFQANVVVSLRPSVLDPAGEATRSAANSLGVAGIQRLRIGKAVSLELCAPDEAEARRRVELLADRLLANPVIEDWTLELQSLP